MIPELLQYSDAGLLILRIAIAIIFIYHGAPKLLQPKTVSAMLGMPVMMVVILGAVEIAASVGLALGIYTQVSAIILAAVMLGAIGMKIMKWNVPFAASDKTGWEFDFVILAALVALVGIGGGSLGVM